MFSAAPMKVMSTAFSQLVIHQLLPAASRRHYNTYFVNHHIRVSHEGLQGNAGLGEMRLIIVILKL